MIELFDQAERDRFIIGHGKNISVIAPAGVGKTHVIVQRILNVAHLPAEVAADRLSRLVVVTYSVRAALQMQERTRIAIREAGLPATVQRAFQQTFFGTIHSYCVQLLSRFGHYLGLPAPFELLRDTREYWNRFLVRGLDVTDGSDQVRELFHFYEPAQLYGLGRDVSPGPEIKVESGPALDVRPLLRFPLQGLRGSMKSRLSQAQEEVARWSEAWVRGDRFFPLPVCPGTKNVEFVQLWQETFSPLHDWLGHAAYAFGRQIANAYESFRLAEAAMTYDDQVRLAHRLLQIREVQQELAEDSPSVLLDEAQDTDPRQFQVLLSVAGIGPRLKQAPEQSFCLVGDFQQAIYVPRSDLAIYQRIHDELIAEPRGGHSRFEVTFRCDEAIIRFVNEVFPRVLHGENGQSKFFTLRARFNAGPGQVVRWICPPSANPSPLTAGIRARHEARFIAESLQRKGFAGLGAESWSQIAILCPRRAWLRQIMRELHERGIPAQLHSGAEADGPDVTAAWFTSLVWVLAHPEDTFEIAGVLREIFGVSDHDMAHFTHGDGDRLRLDRPAADGPPAVARTLAFLREIMVEISGTPLHLAIDHLLEKTALRHRLHLIARLEDEEEDRALDDFLALARQRSAEGLLLTDFALELRTALLQPTPVEEEIAEAVQLMTSHKSKGLEWQTVIVPFLSRAIETKNSSYPKLIQGPGEKERIFRDKGHYDFAARPFVIERERQQYQRLLYVACTRARETLLLVDDEDLFLGQLRRGGPSSVELLGFHEGPNRDVFHALPSEVIGIPPPLELFSLKQMAPAPKPVAFHFNLDHVRANARDFPHRITPHALATRSSDTDEAEARQEREDETIANNPGLLYGTWWHEFVQSIPWSDRRERWSTCFESALELSPDPERSRREWELFLASELAAWLATPGLLIRPEIPFLWPRQPETWIEGIIDLAVFMPTLDTWRVIDWKTNRATDGIVDIYRGQIQAYDQALAGMLGRPAQGSLYLTATGQWLPVA